MFSSLKTRLLGTSLLRRRGSAVLDAALVFPILLSLTFGTVEYGYYFYVKHSLQGAAREGCRAAIVPTSGTTTAAQTAISAALNAAGLNSSATTLDAKYTLAVTPDPASASAGTSITVSVTGTWGTLGSGFRPLGLIGTAKQVRGATVMRKEG